VVAFEGGSVREVVEVGVSGFVVTSVEEAADAIPRACTFDRPRCRAAFEAPIHVAANGPGIYLAIYERMRLGGGVAGRTYRPTRSFAGWPR
jgi:hypothetical protein